MAVTKETIANWRELKDAPGVMHSAIDEYVPDEFWDLLDAYEALHTGMEKINAIRNSIIGFQTMGWSEHIYPLVAALQEAGFEGAGYEKARESVTADLEAMEAVRKWLADGDVDPYAPKAALKRLSGYKGEV